MGEQSGESEEVELMSEGIGESEMEELVPEWGWRRELIPETINERSDQIFLERMTVTEQE